MKTSTPVSLFLNTTSCFGRSILLLLSVSVFASTGSTEDLNKAVSASANSRPINSLQTTISLGAGVFPQAVVVSPNSQTIYVSSYSTSSGGFVSVINSQTDAITTTIPNGGGSLGITPDGTTLYVLGSAEVYVISTATNSVAATLAVTGNELAVSPNGEHVYVTNGGDISIIDTATNQVHLNAIKLPTAGTWIALNPDGRTAYVAGDGGVVQVVGLATRKVKATIYPSDNNAFPAYLAVSPNGKRLFIEYGDGVESLKQVFIGVVATSTNDVINRVTLTKKGTATNFYQTAVTPDGKFLYAPVAEASGLAEVLMLNTATNKVAGTINLGNDSLLQAVAVAPTAPFACAIGFYGDNDEGQVYVIDISPE